MLCCVVSSVWLDCVFYTRERHPTYLLLVFTVQSIFDRYRFEMEKSEVTLIRFTGKNYPAWSFQFQIYLKAKELWGYISGSDPKPTEDKKISSWLTKDAKIKSWILGSIKPHLIMNLKPYPTSKDVGVSEESIPSR
eukprot:TRINITY_DN5737_c0_g1_i1.p1 TRINITY_DN5737_c0_g1~~TRINITY_DN5737_c0_g1_i1.p1  ORF type:complete len:136 (+),score=8.19 TRINITY_DN5737_c0_g1_i1:767-1174(+)